MSVRLLGGATHDLCLSSSTLAQLMFAWAVSWTVFSKAIDLHALGWLARITKKHWQEKMPPDKVICSLRGKTKSPLVKHCFPTSWYLGPDAELNFLTPMQGIKVVSKDTRSMFVRRNRSLSSFSFYFGLWFFDYFLLSLYLCCSFSLFQYNSHFLLIWQCDTPEFQTSKNGSD